MITVIPFKQEHLDRIELKENYAQGECPKTIVNTAFTLVDGDTVIAILGGFPFVPGVIHWWAFISVHVRKKPIEFHKICRKVLVWYEKSEKPRRMQFEVRSDYEMGQRWAEALGFEKEACMKAWAPEGDCYLYARINKCQP